MTQQQELFDISLPKWPALVVHGETVGHDDAAEIIVRTNWWGMHTNDREWLRTVYDLAGIKYDLGECEYVDVVYRDIERFSKDIGALDLHYLHNSRIASSWVGGPHGWCDWSGAITSANYNIGKWPSVREVFDDWSAIAAAFPFLRLWSQLYSGETCEDGTTPLVEFVIGEGKATVCRPTERGVSPVGADLSGFVLGRVGGERGCTAAMLDNALGVTRARRQAR